MLLLSVMIAPDVSSPPWQWIVKAWIDNYGPVLKYCVIALAICALALLLERFLRDHKA